MNTCDTCLLCTKESRLQAFNNIKNKFSAEKNFQYNPAEDSYPETMLLGLTNRCNLSCPYCFVHQNQTDMTLEVAEQAIKWLKSNHQKRNFQDRMGVTFFGGEPLLMYNEIIVPLVEKYSSEIDFTITTNGVLLDEDKVDFFRKYRIQPLLSFDGVPEVQNSQRPGKNCNSFNEVLNNIPYLLLRLPDTVMRATITKDSIPYLYDTVIMAEQLNFKKIVFCPNAYEDWDSETEKELFNQFNKIGLYIYKNLRENNFDTIRVDPICARYSDIMSMSKNSLYFNNHLHRCGLGTTTCAITPTGDIVPCQEKISNPTTILGNIWDGIDFTKHEEYLRNYFERVNSLKCDKECSDREKLVCLSDICPSRLEDLNYTFSTSQCAFIRTALKVAGRLHFLCSNSVFPHIREYFGEED
jgi:uncharacterized protein